MKRGRCQPHTLANFCPDFLSAPVLLLLYSTEQPSKNGTTFCRACKQTQPEVTVSCTSGFYLNGKVQRGWRAATISKASDKLTASTKAKHRCSGAKHQVTRDTVIFT